MIPFGILTALPDGYPPVRPVTFGPGITVVPETGAVQPSNMASGVAPIKQEFRCKARARIVVEAVTGSAAAASVEAGAGGAAAAQPQTALASKARKPQQQPQHTKKKSRKQMQKVCSMFGWRRINGATPAHAVCGMRNLCR